MGGNVYIPYEWLEPIEITGDDIEKIIEGFAVFELPNTHNRYNRIAKAIIKLLNESTSD